MKCMQNPKVFKAKLFFFSYRKCTVDKEIIHVLTETVLPYTALEPREELLVREQDKGVCSNWPKEQEHHDAALGCLTPRRSWTAGGHCQEMVNRRQTSLSLRQHAQSPCILAGGTRGVPEQLAGSVSLPAQHPSAAPQAAWHPSCRGGSALNISALHGSPCQLLQPATCPGAEAQTYLCPELSQQTFCLHTRLPLLLVNPSPQWNSLGLSVVQNICFIILMQLVKTPKLNYFSQKDLSMFQ